MAGCSLGSVLCYVDPEGRGDEVYVVTSMATRDELIAACAHAGHHTKRARSAASWARRTRYLTRLEEACQVLVPLMEDPATTIGEVAEAAGVSIAPLSGPGR